MTNLETPRLLTLTGETHPAAFVTAIDPAAGVALFNYRDAAGNAVDSGNSIARFAPVAPLAKAQPSDPDVYPEIADATLIAAISSAS
jgi:hypothetical protein